MEKSINNTARDDFLKKYVNDINDENFYNFYTINTNQKDIKIKFPIVEESFLDKNKYNDVTYIIVNISKLNNMIHKELKGRFTNTFYFEINKENNCELLLNITPFETNRNNSKTSNYENIAKITFGLTACNIEYYIDYKDHMNRSNTLMKKSTLYYKYHGNNFWKSLINTISFSL